MIASNSDAAGAGVYVNGGTVRRCSIFKNTAQQMSGAGAYLLNGGLVEFCVITNNTESFNQYPGGGVYMEGAASKLRNCLVAYNVAGGNGGGVYMTGGLVESCTVADNNSSTNGGGVWASGGTNLNTISYFNSAGVFGANHLLSGTAAMTWSCTTPAVAGDGNVSDDPQFTARASRDYKLLIGSSAINGGNNQPWMTGATDLDGQRRLMSSRVDMGCYEAMPPGGSVFKFR
jgi:predicted outer membrane repeat protein